MMNDLEKLDYLQKFDDLEAPIIKKYLPIRKQKVIKKDEIKIIVLEPLVKHLLSVENGIIDFNQLVIECSTIKDNEVDLLPISLFVELRDTILNFNNKKEDDKQNEDVKKN